MEELRSGLLPGSGSSENGGVMSTLIRYFRLHSCSPTPQAYRFVIRTLSKTSQLKNIASFLNHLETSEKFDTPESIFNRRHLCLWVRIGEAIGVFFKIPISVATSSAR